VRCILSAWAGLLVWYSTSLPLRNTHAEPRFASSCREQDSVAWRGRLFAEVSQLAPNSRAHRRSVAQKDRILRILLPSERVLVTHGELDSCAQKLSLTYWSKAKNAPLTVYPTPFPAHRVRLHPQPRPRTKLDTPLPVSTLSEQHPLARGPPHTVLLAGREPERDRRRAGRSRRAISSKYTVTHPVRKVLKREEKIAVEDSYEERTRLTRPERWL
jgi:hypothetical protein